MTRHTASVSTVDAADALFDVLDETLDRARWHRRHIQLFFKQGDFFIQAEIYDQRTLRLNLEMIADQLVKHKYPAAAKDVNHVIDNILEEYDNELKRIRLPERDKP